MARQLWEARPAAIMFRINGMSRLSTGLCGATVSLLHQG